MSNRLHEIAEASKFIFDTSAVTMASEKSKIQARKNLLALEKLTKEIRQSILQESKDRKKMKKELNKPVTEPVTEPVTDKPVVEPVAEPVDVRPKKRIRRLPEKVNKKL